MKTYYAIAISLYLIFGTSNLFAAVFNNTDGSLADVCTAPLSNSDQAVIDCSLNSWGWSNSVPGYLQFQLDWRGALFRPSLNIIQGAAVGNTTVFIQAPTPSSSSLTTLTTSHNNRLQDDLIGQSLVQKFNGGSELKLLSDASMEFNTGSTDSGIFNNYENVDYWKVATASPGFAIVGYEIPLDAYFLEFVFAAESIGGIGDIFSIILDETSIFSIDLTDMVLDEIYVFDYILPVDMLGGLHSISTILTNDSGQYSEIQMLEVMSGTQEQYDLSQYEGTRNQIPTPTTLALLVLGLLGLHLTQRKRIKRTDKFFNLHN